MSHRNRGRRQCRPRTPFIATASAAAPVAAALALVLSVASAAPVLADAGDPLADLSPAHQTWFSDGLAAFSKTYGVADGLGPVFNAPSCVACHSVPAPGGGSALPIHRFGRDVAGTFDPLVSSGGSLLQTDSIDPACAETLPPEATIVAERITTPMFGAGLIESILDEDITRNADPDDRNGDGVSGRVHAVQYPGRIRIGRFGWKAHDATLLAFNAEAMLVEMGITNMLNPNEERPNGDASLLVSCMAIEGVADPDDDPAPEDGFSDLVKVTNYARLLAPPTAPVRPRGPGWRAFRRARCTACHVARFETGPHTIPALSRQRFYPYSDFLLHDMGTLGDGIAQGAASTTEMRTAPLWGVGARTAYLHDGRAATLVDAIMAHDGEAVASRERFLNLTPAKQADLLAFVAGL